MKKVLMVLAAAFVLSACENEELAMIAEKMVSEKVKDAQEKSEKKEDVNFRIFKDRTKGGKEE